MPALLRGGAEAGIPAGPGVQKRSGSVHGSVILPEHFKILPGLAGQGSQLVRKIFFSLIGCQKDHRLHQLTPHFRKYLQTERI